MIDPFRIEHLLNHCYQTSITTLKSLLLKVKVCIVSATVAKGILSERD